MDKYRHFEFCNPHNFSPVCPLGVILSDFERSQRALKAYISGTKCNSVEVGDRASDKSFLAKLRMSEHRATVIAWEMARDGLSFLTGDPRAVPDVVGPQTDTFSVRYDGCRGENRRIVTEACRMLENEFPTCSEPGNRANHHY